MKLTLKVRKSESQPRSLSDGAAEPWFTRPARGKHPESSSPCRSKTTAHLMLRIGHHRYQEAASRARRSTPTPDLAKAFFRPDGPAVNARKHRQRDSDASRPRCVEPRKQDIPCRRMAFYYIFWIPLIANCSYSINQQRPSQPSSHPHLSCLHRSRCLPPYTTRWRGPGDRARSPQGSRARSRSSRPRRQKS